MSTASLRPILRPSTLPSLPLASLTPTTYICQTCRHARLLRRPRRPYTFTQLIALSDGSAFTIRTTSPQPVYRSSRDTRNAPLWNPRNADVLNVEDDEAGRLSGFRARFGRGFDAVKEKEEEEKPTEVVKKKKKKEEGGVDDTEMQKGPFFRQPTETKHTRNGNPEHEYYEFEEDDANLLDLISSYGQEVKGPKAPAPVPAKKGKK